jgi:hypothetical protein
MNEEHSTLNIQRPTSDGWHAKLWTRSLERINRNCRLNGKSVGSFREVLDCGSPLPFWIAGAAVKKRQRAAAVQDAGARFGCPSLFGDYDIFENALTGDWKVPGTRRLESLRHRARTWSSAGWNNFPVTRCFRSKLFNQEPRQAVSVIGCWALNVECSMFSHFHLPPPCGRP